METNRTGDIKPYKTLINELEEIVDKQHIGFVKKVIDDLTRINNFKVELLYTKDITIVYRKVANFLSKHFHIVNYKIVQNIHHIEETKFIGGEENKTYEYKFIHPLDEIGSLEFYLNNEHLNSFEKVYLNTFLDEVTGVLYTKYVLNELQNSTYVDHLTKLKNRQSFNEEMKEFIPLAIREDMKLGALIINIDRFRAVNDEHGTKFGDEFLKMYAQVIKDTIRSSDIAVRFGGGEFLVLLVNILDDEKAYEIAEKIQTKLSEAVLISPYGDNFTKTVCIGISMFPQDSRDIHVVIKNAETALISAQDQGRNKIARFVEEETDSLEFF